MGYYLNTLRMEDTHGPRGEKQYVGVHLKLLLSNRIKANGFPFLRS